MRKKEMPFPGELCIPEDIADELSRSLLMVNEGPYRDYLGFLPEAVARTAPLINYCSAQLLDLRINPSSPGALVLSGLPLDPDLPRTPLSSTETISTKKTFLSEGLLLSVATFLGDVFSYVEEDDGIAIRGVIPRAEKSEVGGAYFGSNQLRLHSEIAWARYRPDFLLLFCLRSDREGKAQTPVANGKEALGLLAGEDVLHLRKRVYRVGMPESLSRDRQGERLWTEPIPIVTGEEDFPEFRANFRYVETDCAESRGALERFEDAASAVAHGLRLRPGMILILDNRKVLHGRTRFQPRFDGRDRWLQQIYVRRDSWPARATAGEETFQIHAT